MMIDDRAGPVAFAPMRESRRRAFPWVIVAVVVLLAGTVFVLVRESRTDGNEQPAAQARVAADGTALTLDGRPWFPVGFNAYQLGTDWSVNEGCGAEVDLDAYFSALPPHSLTRFSLYSSLARNKADGARDFAPLDAVFAAARRHDQLVLPVLGSGEGECEGDVFKDRDWYAGGWRNIRIGQDGAFGEWLTVAVTRYRGEPALAGWSLVNEPEASECTGDGCHWRQRTCPADATAVMRAFFDEAGAQLRDLDPAHLIFAGTLGEGQCGFAGDGMATIGASPFVDVLEFHDYGGQGALPGHGAESLAARLTQARDLGKPLLVGEVGIRAGSCLSLAERAGLIRAKIEGQREAGTAGALIWAFVPDPRTAQCTYDVGPGDPLWQVVHDLAAES